MKVTVTAKYQETPEDPSEPEPTTPETPSKPSSGGGSSGCNAGFGLFGGIIFLYALISKKLL